MVDSDASRRSINSATVTEPLSSSMDNILANLSSANINSLPFNFIQNHSFDRKYYTPLDQELDVEAMQEAAHFLEGKHDYKSFCGNSRMKKSTVRIVDTITVRRRKGYVYLTFHGTGFLQNMVRIMSVIFNHFQS